MTSIQATDTPISSRLARRLAAAADGYRNGETVWFTAMLEPDETGNFHISKAIVSDVRPADPTEPGRKLFGPYRSEQDAPSRSTPIVKITLHVQVGREIREVDFDATGCDAMFWSTSALDKFAVPHYVAFEGLSEATRLQNDYVKNAAVFAVVHDPNTEYSLRQMNEKGGSSAVPPLLLSI